MNGFLPIALNRRMESMALAFVRCSLFGLTDDLVGARVVDSGPS